VILASAVNQDGRTPAFSIPSPEAQAEMLERALAAAGLPPTAVQYVEAHGTGTPVGDPLEAQAIGSVFGVGRTASAPFLLGSVKTNIGHLEAGAGIAGLIKTTLALAHRQIPPSLHFTDANPDIPLDELHLRVPTRLEPWPAAPGDARAGVNSFGFGGSNAHVLLGEAPDGNGRSSSDTVMRTHLLPLSARTPAALRELAGRYAELLGQDDVPALPDLCYTAAARRSHHEYRLALVAASTAEVRGQLESFLAGEQRAGMMEGRSTRQHEPKLAFVFSGMGPQWWGMGRQLLEQEPVFRDALEECDRILRPLSGWSLLGALTADEQRSRVHDADLAHVSNLAMQVGLAALWRAWGIVPDAVVGHSSGEMAAAYTAGALGLEEVLHLAYHRGRLQHRLSGTGRMLAVGLSAEATTELIGTNSGRVSLAAINSPGSVTLSGEVEPLERLAAELERRQIFHRFLRVDVPYHGPQMEAVRGELLDSLRELRPRRVETPLVSSVTGRWTEGEELGAGHWWRNLRDPVRFADAVDRLLEAGCELFVEVGPHPVTSGSLIECLAHRGVEARPLPTLRRQEEERAVMLRTLAALYAQGRSMSWAGLYPTGTCLHVPTYPWQRESHWYEGATEADSPTQAAGVDTGHPLLGRRLRSPAPVWEPDLGSARLAYLEDHVVQESVVFPAAAYVEIALAVAREVLDDAAAVVERLEFRRLLLLDPRQESLLQVVHRSERSVLEIHAAARTAEPEWSLCATAILRPTAADTTTGGADLSAIRERCGTRSDAAAVYHGLGQRGLRYGAAFRGLCELWRGEAEALGRIRLPHPEAADADAYSVHPALLDAAFHTLAGAVEGAAEPGATLVPVSLARVELLGRPGSECWSHALFTHGSDGALVGDVRLLDGAGRVVLICRGLRLQTLAAPPQSRRVQEWLYEMGWEESALPGVAPSELPRPAAVAAEVQPLLRDSADALRLRTHDEVVEPVLRRLARRHFHAALRELGWSPVVDDRTPASVVERLGVLPVHRPYLHRLLEIFGPPPVQGSADAEAEEFSARALAQDVVDEHPDHRAEIELLTRCGERLPEILRGEADPRELLFGDSPEVLTALYRTSPVSRFYNTATAEVVASATRGVDPARPLRVLEVGAGTGGLTSAVLPRLRAGALEYRFTDVSPYFLAGAREEFGTWPGMHFSLFDVESDPAAQGLALGAFDVVLAANVIHATADIRASLGNLRRLLMPGGLLVLLELTRPDPWIEVIFGLLDGWWRFADQDLRPSHALLGREAWARPLAEVGFEDVEILNDPAGAELPPESVVLARSPRDSALPVSPTSAGPRHWLLYADRIGVADRLAPMLEKRGDLVTRVHIAPGHTRREGNRFEIGPGSSGDVLGLLEQLADEGNPVDGVIHLWSLDAPRAEEAATSDLMQAQRVGCGSVLDLVHALERGGTRPELWLVTAGAQAVEDGIVPGVAQAPLWGLGRVLGNEQPDLRPRMVDLGPHCTSEELDGLVAEICGGGAGEIALRGRRRWVRRFGRAPDPTHATTPRLTMSPESAPFELEVGIPGALETLGLREARRIAPAAGHILVRVLATGLNFRDVLLGLGVIEPTQPGGDADAGTLSSEFAGVVLECGEEVHGFQPGDEVIGLAIGAFGSQAHARQELVVLKPPNLSFEEGASVPGVYLTAHYALNHLARISAGERVLIHTASGGVGHAALDLCRRAGAEVFATAGTPEKREYLRSLGVEHVMDSRSLAWADEVLERTGGEGVDVILNSLPGAAIARGLEVLRPFGRFVEIGKRDIYQDSALGLLPFRKNLAFFAVDLVRLCLERTHATGAMLRELIAKIAAGELELPPRTDFDLGDAEDAYRLMAQARHIGKIVLTLHGSAYPVRPSVERPLFRADATYLITGGTGGFGLAVAEWMAQQGAGNLVLMSRSGIPKDNAAALDRLARSAATVHVVQGDAGRDEDVARVLATIRAEMPPLRGVVHMAMVLDDALLGELDHERFEAVMAPKVAGAWTLHRLTRGDPLDHFVLFSSIASAIGHPLQGNYAAANAFLDSLAPHRRALGLPAVAIGWGTLEEVGYVSRHAEIQEHIARLGTRSFSSAEAMEVLDEVLRRDPVQVVAARLEWDTLQKWNRSLTGAEPGADPAAADAESGREAPGSDRAPLALLRRTAPDARQPLLEAHLRQRVARVLGTSPDRVEVERPLPELGLDSLLAVELLTAVRLDLGVQLPVVKLLQGTSTRGLAGLVLAQLALDGADAAASPVSPEPTPASSDRPVHLPLSFEQRGLWFLDRWEGGNSAYHLFAAARLDGPLDVPRLERAIRDVVRRHDALRAYFPIVDDLPVQVIQPRVEVDLARVDLREAPEGEREAAVQELARTEIHRPFDLDRAPLLRATLFRLAGEEHVVLLTMHHLIADAFSMTLLVKEIMAIYGAVAPSGRPGRYADYVRWQTEALDDGTLREQLAYWRERLADAPPPLALPVDRPRPETQSFRGAHLRFDLSAELSEALRELSRREGVTLFVTLLAAYQTVLHRYSGQEDVCVGTPVAMRNRPGSETLVGCCMNTLALRTDLSGNPDFRELLQRARETTLGAFANQEVPFDRVVEELRSRRDPSRSPLFQTMLILHNLRWPELQMEGLAVRPQEVESGTSTLDLTLIIDTGECLRGTLEYNVDLFDASTAARLLTSFEGVLESVVADPHQRLASLPENRQRERLLEMEWNDTAVDFGEPGCLHGLVAAQALRTPDAPAVVFRETQLTYRELELRADRLAAQLGALGVGSGDVVGVCAEPSLEMEVGVLGTLKAGGAYLPLDPRDPRERLELILRDAQVRVLVTTAGLLGRIPADVAEVVLVDAAAPSSTDAVVERATPETPAYVIYTSGSTGAPRGVLVPHRAIWNQVKWRQLAFPLDASDVVLQCTPFGFDPCVWELFGPLAAGARVVFPDPGRDGDTEYLVRTIAREGVTNVQVVPSLLGVLLEEPELPGCGSLRRVFCGGEPLTPTLQELFFRRLPSVELINLYGATETAVDATWWRCRPQETLPHSVPIGRPIANVRAHVVDTELRPVAVGMPGELCIAGACLAGGYLNHPEHTAERFLPDPFVDGAILYRTGDRARRLPDGSLEFLGRLDEQLKIRGMRVEPGEIEAALLRHPDVREAAVAVVGETADERRLVAFVAGGERHPVTGEAVRDHLERVLPRTTMPSHLVVLDALPRLSNGKLDRHRLPRLARPGPEQAGVIAPPRDTTELRLVRLWEDFFSRPVSVRDNFFELGGTSLSAARMVGRLRREHGREFPLSLLFRAPSVEAIARTLRQTPSPLQPSPLVPIQPRGSGPPFFCVHPMGGDVFCYYELASLLDDHPFFGLQAPGLEAEEEPLTSIEALAEYHLQAVRSRQPEGPYLLGGWSMGGVVALEMARRLEEEGRSVALLALLDPHLDSLGAEEIAEACGEFMRGFATDLGRDGNPLVLPELPWPPNSEAEIRTLLDLLQTAGGVSFDLDRSQARRYLGVLEAHTRAMQAYVPRPYTGSVTLIRADERADLPTSEVMPVWQRIAGGGVAIHRVPGTHYTMLRHPNVQQLAALLTSRIEETCSPAS
jgi:amino acid adenylation domain-containing protein